MAGSGTEVDERDADLASLKLYQDIARHAQEATGARWVQYTLLVGDEVRQVAVSNFRVDGVHRLLLRAQSVIPGFHPTDVRIPLHTNPAIDRIYVEGGTFVGTLAEVAQGSVPPALIALAQAAGMRYTVSIPLKVADGRIVGALTFHAARPFGARRMRMLHAFAAQAALTMENRALTEALRRQVRQIERSRAHVLAADDRVRRTIAEELHGRVQTRLLLAWNRVREALAALDALDRAFVPAVPGRPPFAEATPPDPLDPPPNWERLRTLLSAALDELDDVREHDVRSLSHALHPSVIRLGLSVALRSLADAHEELATVELRVDPTLIAQENASDLGLCEACRLAVYRAAESALANATRHGHARRIHIDARQEGNARAVVEIFDDGEGFDTSQAVPGLGLAVAQARLEHVGGTWECESHPGQGTRVRISIPLRSPREHATHRL